MIPPTVLTIAGSDSSGGAGIQADLKSIAANGGYGASVLTALTAQNTRGVTLAEPVSAQMLRAQLDAVFDDLRVAAVKTGMLPTRDAIRIVAETLRRREPRWFVCDPVMISKSGYALLPAECVERLRGEILPLADLVTPNVHEAEALAGMRVATVEDAEAAGRAILAMGPRGVLVKGGHLQSAPATDVLVTAAGARVMAGTHVDAAHTHGTGCTYSAAIATQLAHGRSLVEAVERAKRFLTAAIRAGLPVGEGIGPTDPFFFLREGAGARAAAGTFGADPSFRRAADARDLLARGGVLCVLTDAGEKGAGAHAALAGRAGRGGADLVQLREKRPRSTRALVEEVRGALAAMAGTQAVLVVNDRVDVALAAGVDAVHLGRDDLPAGLARELLGPDALLGATANSLEEARRADGLPVDYLGVGPVYGTRSKENPAPELGLDGLRAIVAGVRKPVLAIGNITAERVAEVLDAGAAGVAVLSAVTRDPDPERATMRIRKAIDAWRRERKG